MIIKKAYKDLTVEDFAGLTPDQIQRVLDTYAEEKRCCFNNNQIYENYFRSCKHIR